MPRFFTLASSSRGNASCYADSEGAVLIDCGIPYQALCRRLEESSCPVERLCGVLITHEHSDHTKGLNTLLKHHSIPVFATQKVLSALKSENKIPPTACCHPLEEGEEFSLADATILPFATSHDSVDSLGFRFFSDESSLAILTDTGIVTDEMLDLLDGVNVILLEANFEPSLLRRGSYPPFLKARIAGDRGHLSNQQAADVATNLYLGGTSRFILGHLSDENNRPELATSAVLAALQAEGGRQGIDFLLAVAPKDAPLPVCIF